MFLLEVVTPMQHVRCRINNVLIGISQLLNFTMSRVRDGNAFYFEGSKGKGIEIPKTISYKELLGVVHHILKLDPTNCFLSMKYVFNANIPTSPIQLIDDGDVKFFIGLNCTNGKLPVPLCITVEKRIDNHN